MMDITDVGVTALITGLVTSLYGLIGWALRTSYKARREAAKTVDVNRVLIIESLAVIFRTLIDIIYGNLEKQEFITPAQHRQWSYLFSSYAALNGEDAHVSRLNEIIATKDVKEG